MKKIISLFCLVFSSVVMLSGCNGPAPEPAPVKVKVNVFGGQGTTEVNSGTEVTVSAYIDQNNPFINWTIDGTEVSTDSSYTFKVNKDTTITANYTFGQYVQNIVKNTYKDFKILNLTDIQLHDGESTDITFRVLDELITREQPNMITFLGDMINDDSTYDSKVNVKAVIAKIDSYNIPWAPIFGNHDFEDYGSGSKKSTTSAELASWYKAAKNCLYMDGPSLEGDPKAKSNYVVNIIDSTTLKPVESLIFSDSRLAGLQDNFLPFYKNAINHTSFYNDKKVVPSILFTHIAIPQYADAYELSKEVEYRDMTGVFQSNPTKLVAGTKKLFPLVKELGSTKMIVCGHDHENSYYQTYQDVKLCYTTKSSDGDNFKNPNIVFPLGGSIIKLSNGKDEEIYYTKANAIFKVEDTGDLKDAVVDCEMVSRWKYSGAKLVFDVELPEYGQLTFNLQGTNVLIDGKNETYLGAWNRLTANNKIYANTKVADFGTLEQIEGNKYHYTLELKDIPLNTGGSETARGDETIRLIYFSGATDVFTISNLHFEYDEVTEKDQIDLKDAVIDPIPEVTLKKRSAEGATGTIPARPVPTVNLNGSSLVFGKDFYCDYKNNTAEGEATITIIPSAIGAHKYKGFKSTTFDVTEQSKRGVLFAAGEDYTKDFKSAKSLTTDSVIIDIYFTSASNTHIQFMLCDTSIAGWNAKFGYFQVNADGTFGGTYAGLSITKLEDGYYRVTCVLKDITKYSGEMPVAGINLLYIWGKNSTASGYIDIQ